MLHHSNLPISFSIVTPFSNVSDGATIPDPENHSINFSDRQITQRPETGTSWWKIRPRSLKSHRWQQHLAPLPDSQTMTPHKYFTEAHQVYQ